MNEDKNSKEDFPSQEAAEEEILNVEQNMVEKLLHERVSELRAFFEVSQDLMCITDLNGKFIRANSSWKTIMGYEPEWLVGQALVDFIHPGDLPFLKDELNQLSAREEKKLNIVLRVRTSQGVWRYLEWRSQIQDERGYAAARDITERIIADEERRKQTRLLEYRQNFEEILTTISTRFINLPLSQVNQEINTALMQIGRLEQVDRSYLFLIDYENQTMSNTHEWCADGVEPQIDNLKDLPLDIFPWWIAKLNRLEEIHIPFVAEMPPEAREEKEILESQSIQSVLVIPLVTQSKVFGFLGFDSVSHQRYWSSDSILLIKMVGDILSNATMRLKMQDEIIQSEARNRALLSALPDMIFRIREDGVVLDFNASSPELLPAPPEEIIGGTLSDALPEAVSLEAMAVIKQALATHEIQTMEYTIKIGEASHVFEARIKDSGPDEVTAIVREISERARLEQMKSDFINRATHELRTPIATMILMANLIDGGTEDEEYQEYWTVLKSELYRERQLVEDMLSAGRLENNQANLHFRFLDCLEILKQVIRLTELTAREKNISISLEINNELDETAFLISADETALTQVFINLLGNAIKFTPASGSIRIVMQNLQAGVQVSIIDSGIGIPSEDMPLLFTRFFRGTNAIYNEIPGTGIGLYIVRSIVEKHGGNIKVHSEVDKGSQFVIWLPIKQD